MNQMIHTCNELTTKMTLVAKLVMDKKMNMKKKRFLDDEVT